MQIASRDVYEKFKGMQQPLARLRFVVEFAFVPWARVTRSVQMDWHAGLLVFTPETASWFNDSHGEVWATSWSDYQVGAFQSRLQGMLTAVADGTESVVLTSYPIRLTWRPAGQGLSFGELFGDDKPLIVSDVPVGFPYVIGKASAPSVACDHENGLNGVELAVLNTALLLREFPDRILRCPAPRSKRKRGGGTTCGAIFCGRTDQKWCTPACAARGKRLAAPKVAAPVQKAVPVADGRRRGEVALI